MCTRFYARRNFIWGSWSFPSLDSEAPLWETKWSLKQALLPNDVASHSRKASFSMEEKEQNLKSVWVIALWQRAENTRRMLLLLYLPDNVNLYCFVQDKLEQRKDFSKASLLQFDCKTMPAVERKNGVAFPDWCSSELRLPSCLMFLSKRRSGDRNNLWISFDTVLFLSTWMLDSGFSGSETVSSWGSSQEDRWSFWWRWKRNLFDDVHLNKFSLVSPD